MRACELESPVAIKADKYDMPAARNWQNYSGEADSVKIYTRVELLVRFFVRHLSPFMRHCRTNRGWLKHWFYYELIIFQVTL